MDWKTSHDESVPCLFAHCMENVLKILDIISTLALSCGSDTWITSIYAESMGYALKTEVGGSSLHLMEINFKVIQFSARCYLILLLARYVRGKPSAWVEILFRLKLSYPVSQRVLHNFIQMGVETFRAKGAETETAAECLHSDIWMSVGICLHFTYFMRGTTTSYRPWPFS